MVVLLLALIGLVFLGQGLGLIPGSFMTGRLEWAIAGGAMLVVAGLIVWRGQLRR